MSLLGIIQRKLFAAVRRYVETNVLEDSGRGGEDASEEVERWNDG